MKRLTKTIGATLAGIMLLMPFAATAAAVEGQGLTVAASSNFSPTVTKSFDASTKQITTTWWLQAPEDKMVNVQGILTYDSTKLTVDMTDGVNRTYNAETGDYTEGVLCITEGKGTVVNYQPKTLPEGAKAGIRFNATSPGGCSMGSADRKVPFFSVTFIPVDGAAGDTDVHLDVNLMSVRGADETGSSYHKLIRHSEVVDTDTEYLPEEASAVYAGAFDADYKEEEPTTAEPTTAEPTTVAPTTAVPTTVTPTTVAPTTVAPTTVAPTTVAPTTVAPTTVAPTTVAPTTVAPTTVAPTTVTPTTVAPTTVTPTTVAPTTVTPTTVAPTTVAPTTVLTDLSILSRAKVDENACRYTDFDFFASPDSLVTKTGDTVTIAYKIDTTDAENNTRAILSIQWVASYDDSVLQLSAVEMPKITKGAAYNTTKAGVVKANASSIAPAYQVKADDDFIVFRFKVLKAGETEVSVTLTDLAFEENMPEPTTEAPATAAPTTKPVPAYLLGDVNDDGDIDITDVTLVQQQAAEVISFSESQLLAGDVNKDGRVDISDATLIQKYIADIITEF